MKLPLTAMALMGAASAANSTTSLWLAGFGNQEILGSMIGSDATATTYDLACGNQKNCGLPTPFTFTQGPSTMAYTYTQDGKAASVTLELGCNITNSASGICTTTIDGAYMQSIVLTHTITAASGLGLQEVTITAGAIAYATAAGPSKTTSYAESTVTYGVDYGVATAPADGDDMAISATGSAAMVTPAPFLMGAMALAFVAI